VLNGVVTFAAALAAGTVIPTPSNVPVRTLVPNGPVKAIVRVGDTAYIGGDFTRIGPASGSGVVLNTTSGVRDGRWPAVAGGEVRLAASDGSGGWYIAGEFSHVGRLPRMGLAHILRNKSVDRAWDPRVDGSAVDAIVASRRRVYVGGSFTRIAGTHRRFLVALDRRAGRPTALRLRSTSPVSTLALAGSSLYVANASTVAAYDAATGQLRPWRIRIRVDPCRFQAHGDCIAVPEVRALAVSGRTVFIVGFFNVVNGALRRDAAAVDRATGRPLPWAPRPNRSINAIALAGGIAYVGGDFTRVGGSSRTHLAALEMGRGRATSWNPRERARVERLVVSSRAVFVVRSWSSSRPEDGLAAYDRATGKRLPWHPAPNAEVLSLARYRNQIYAGGTFTGLRSAKRLGLAAINLKTGALEAWNPGTTGSIDPEQPTVEAIETDGRRLYIGGDFVRAAGQKRNYLAAFDLGDGALTDWNPNADGEVTALVAAGSTVFAAGQFEHVDGAAHDRVAKLDERGNAMPFAAEISGVGFVLALARSGNTLYVGGRFETANTTDRNNACAFDATTGALLAWNPDADSVVWTLAVSGSTVYAGGVFTEIGGKSRMSIAGLDPITGEAQGWNVRIGGSAVLGSGASALVSSLVLSGSTLYVGGDFDKLAGLRRVDLAVFDLDAGRLTAWAPKPAGPAFPQEMAAIVPAADGVLVGGTFLSMGGLPQAHFALFR
jgi:hypothetical protein